MTLRHIPQAFTAALCLLLTPQTAPAQAPSRLHSPGSAAISPDGKTVAWTLRQHEGSTLHLTNLADSTKDTLITPAGTSNCSNTDPVWSPDATTLAFTSTCTGDKQKPDQEQIFLWSAATGEIKQLTHLTGNIEQAAWSPDGKSLAFLFVENATRSAGALDAMKPWSGVIGEDGIEIQRVYSVDTATGKGGFLTGPHLHIYEFDWAPNSRQIAFIGANPPGENNWWVAKLYVTMPCVAPGNSFSANGCGLYNPTQIVLDTTEVSGTLHGLQIAVPRWSPDGKRIALIGGLMSDQGSTGGDVWVVNADGKSAPFNVTPNIDGTPVYEAWIDDKTIGMVEDRRGHIVLPDYDVATRALVPKSTLDMGEVSLSGGPIKDAISFTPYGQFAFIQSSLTHAPEVYAGPLDHLQQLTHLNDGLKPDSKTESIEWDNEGFHVQGWLTYPKNYDPHKKYPLIVSVHGGPSASIGPRWGMGDNWADAGYFEFQPNPRGSFGQSEAFTKANIKDFGYGDLRDILKGMDAIEAKVSIDKTREGLTGWSYGGFMTMFDVTQTHRFRAAVAGAGISDWLSYYGENSIDQWMIPFFGASVYDDPAIYAKSSAISFIKNVTTPTLVIVGDRDGECPAPQSFEFWHALRDLGVKTQLVVYPNEGHGFRDPAHIKDRNDRILKWFNENMPEKQ